jgi:hypothetical protein
VKASSFSPSALYDWGVSQSQEGYFKAWDTNGIARPVAVTATTGMVVFIGFYWLNLASGDPARIFLG